MLLPGLLFLGYFFGDAFSQEKALGVSNVNFTTENDRVIVAYDLQGNEKIKYTVCLTVSCDFGMTFSLVPVHIRGAVGARSVQPGFRRQIVWEYLKDFPEGLAGDSYVFSVEAFEEKPRSWWPYMAAGLLAGGLTAVVTTLVSSETAKNCNRRISSSFHSCRDLIMRSDMQIRRSWWILIVCIGLLFITGISCHQLAPNSDAGGICLIVNYEEGSGSLRKPAEVLKSMRLVLMCKKEIIYDEIKSPLNGYFDFTITNLNVEYRYNLFLEGMATSSLSSVRGEAKGIKVMPDEITPVRVTMRPFYPQLIAPDSSTSIQDGAIQFVWSRVYGARYYVLAVCKSIEFKNDEIELTRIVGQDTSYTTSDLGKGFTYFWRVSCADSMARGGRWSECKRFMVN